VAASFRADSHQQDAVQLLEDSAIQLTEARMQKLDAQHKLKQKEVEALLSKRDTGRLAFSLRHRDAQLADLESRVQHLVSALRPHTRGCKIGAHVTDLTKTVQQQEVAAKRCLAYVKQTATQIASLQTQAEQHELAAQQSAELLWQEDQQLMQLLQQKDQQLMQLQQKLMLSTAALQKPEETAKELLM